jgi:hypothetical protein
MDLPVTTKLATAGQKQSPKIEVSLARMRVELKTYQPWRLSVKVGVSILIVILERSFTSCLEGRYDIFIIYFLSFWLARSLLVAFQFMQPRLMVLDCNAFLMLTLGVASHCMECAAWASSSGKLQGSEGSVWDRPGHGAPFCLLTKMKWKFHCLWYWQIEEMKCVEG